MARSRPSALWGAALAVAATVIAVAPAAAAGESICPSLYSEDAELVVCVVYRLDPHDPLVATNAGAAFFDRPPVQQHAHFPP